jgi:WD40 repeat protein
MMKTKTLILLSILFLLTARAFGQVLTPVIQDTHPLTRYTGTTKIVASNDRRFVLSYSDNGDYRLWDVPTGKLLHSFKSQTSGGLPSFTNRSSGFYRGGPSLSPDNSYLLTEDGETKGYILWDVVTGKEIRKYCTNGRGDSIAYTQMELLPHDQLLVLGLDVSQKHYFAGIMDIYGKPLKTFYFDRPFRRFEKEVEGYHGPIAINKDQTLLAMGTSKGKVFLFDLKSLKLAEMKSLEPKTVFEIGGFPIEKVAFSDDGKQLITSNYRSTKVWDVNRNKLNRSFFYGTITSDNGGSILHTVLGGISANGKVVFYNDTTKHVDQIFDTATGKLLRQPNFNDSHYEENFSLINGIGGEISDDGRYLFKLSGYSDEIQELDLLQKKTIATIRMSEIFAVSSITYNGLFDELYIGKIFNDAIILSLKNGQIRSLRNFVYDGDTVQRNKHNNQIHLMGIFATKNIWLSSDQKYILTADLGLPLSHPQYAYVWDARTKQNLEEIKDIVWEDENVKFYKSKQVNAKWTNMFGPLIANQKLQRIEKQLSTEKKIYGWRINNLSGGRSKDIYPIDPNSADPYSTLQAGAQLSSDGRLLYMGIASGDIFVYRISDSKLLRTIKLNNDSWGGGFLVDFELPPEEHHIYAIINKGYNRVVKADIMTGAIITTFGPHEADVANFTRIPEHHLLTTVADDKRVCFWDERNGKLLVTMIISGNEYVLYTPDGYYYASRNGLSMLHYVKGLQVFLAEQFDLKYNRPDKVFEALGTLEPGYLETYRAAYEQRLRRNGLKYTNTQINGIINAPVVQIANTSGETVSDNHISIRFNCSDSIHKISRVKIWINGVMLRSGNYGFFPPRRSLDTVQMVPLNAGQNIVEVSAINDVGVESIHAFTQIKSVRSQSKVKLYLIAIAVDHYQKLQPLHYAIKDARDVIKLYQQRGIYSEIIVDSLFDTRFQSSGLEAARAHLRKASAQDQVILFYSGHGISDGKNLYLAPPTTSSTAFKKTGIALDTLTELLARTSALNKLMLLDACQSGEAGPAVATISATGFTGPLHLVPKGNNKGISKLISVPQPTTAFDLMKDIFADLTDNNSGATIIAAARNAGQAKERTDLQNGVFTSCLLKGLRDFKADLDADKTITTYELGQYLYKAVPMIENDQIPEIRAENPLNRFVMWK